MHTVIQINTNKNKEKESVHYTVIIKETANVPKMHTDVTIYIGQKYPSPSRRVLQPCRHLHKKVDSPHVVEATMTEAKLCNGR
jgi:hypothetical protein